MRGLFLSLLLWCAGQALADEPLAPAANFSTTSQGVTLTGLVDKDTTRVTAAGGVDWTIPHWLRWPYVSPDGRAVLALTDSGNLIGTRDPDQIVLTLHRTGAEPLEAALSALMDPADMPQTVSHYAWMDGLVWENDGWTLTLTDGGIIRIDPVTGVFTRQ
jgi:hypothetical protein